MAREVNREVAEKSLANKKVCANLLDALLSNRSGKLIRAVAGGGRKHEGGLATDESLFPGLPDDMALDIVAWISRSDYPTLACLNTKFKSLIGSEYLYQLRRKLGIIEHWVFMACILTPWEAFDPARRRWMRLPRMPCDECFTHADKESLAVGTDLLVFGRELKGFAIWKYSLLSRDWSRNQHMNSPRCLFGSASVGEMAIVAGGCDLNGVVVQSAEVYNSELGTWHPLADLSGPRKMCSGFFMDGKFYVIGGMSSNAANYLSCGEEYDLGKGTWRKIENMYPAEFAGVNQSLPSPPLVAVVNNELYTADVCRNEVKKYSKANNTWSAVKALPIRAGAANGWGMAFRGCGRRLLVIGGPGVEAAVMYSWEPQHGDLQDWNLLAVKQGAGSFVYNCAIMGC
ncbi:F-box/kelch-repeat protein [Morus notabilis]|uniref:F-box/kelch-repeat protein n=1 Tax=Morus notabilis TaxID=981085 RepID=W9QYJ2_9ROSA|nr:F-box/kelch-repeat protein At5g60570 [Morus notabilis]EXB29132.1 F-box/kelch-repeat protein [Morus notabilis]